MHEDESGLKELLQDFSLLPGRDRRKITKHLSGRDKILVQKLLSKTKEAIKLAEVEAEVEEEEIQVKTNESETDIDLSCYSLWLQEKLKTIFEIGNLQIGNSVTEAGRDAVLRSIKNTQQPITSERSTGVGNKRSIRSSIQKWGIWNGG